MIAEKPRVRVKAGAIAFPTAQPMRPAPTMRYLRPDRSGILAMRRAVTRDAKVDVWEAAERASALAYDFLQNSGWLAGAATQILCDTIGDELKLNCRAALSGFGYTPKQVNAWCRKVEAAWRRWAWNAKECDLGGKATIAEMADAVLRSYLAAGEGFAVFDYLTVRERRARGLETGTKVSLVAPHRCPRTTLLFDGLDQGIFHDAAGRPTHYRFKVNADGIERNRDLPARDVLHVMDRGEHLNSPRGISVLAPILRVIAQSDQLADATLATALLQTIFAATITSPEPSQEAFDAIRTLEDTSAPEGYSDADWATLVGGVQADLVEVWGQRLDALKSGGVNLADSARIAHQGPGEKLQFHTAATPGSQYLPFNQNLQREMARCLGVTFESLTLDNKGATYSSVRMGVACIWPIVLRRRTRIVMPFMQAAYERWLEEQIELRKIPFKGGVEAFRRDRESVFQAEWNGPAAPSADDYRSAMAAKVRLELGLRTYADECASDGKNAQEQIAQIGAEIKAMTNAGMPHPFGKAVGGAGPKGMAADGNREPAKADA